MMHEHFAPAAVPPMDCVPYFCWLCMVSREYDMLVQRQVAVAGTVLSMLCGLSDLTDAKSPDGSLPFCWLCLVSGQHVVLKQRSGTVTAPSAVHVGMLRSPPSPPGLTGAPTFCVFCALLAGYASLQKCLLCRCMAA